MSFSFTIEAVKIPAIVRRGRYRLPVIKEEIHRAVATIIFLMRNAIVIDADSTNVFGMLKTSWQTEIQQYKHSTMGRVFSSNPAAFVFEKGAKTHFPPFNKMKEARSGKGRRKLVGLQESVLAPWIRKKLGKTDKREIRSIAYFISRKFKKIPKTAKNRWSNILKRDKKRYTEILERMIARILLRIKRDS